jgi:hypothetical protein
MSFRAAAILPPPHAHLCSSEAAAVFQSQKLRPRITGPSSSRAELAKGEDPKALFDAAVTELRAREC